MNSLVSPNIGQHAPRLEYKWLWLFLGSNIAQRLSQVSSLPLSRLSSTGHGLTLNVDTVSEGIDKAFRITH